ncbi:glutamate racemase [Parcubacteria bacterium SG8_24]|nr:MAG: glutamate racemase [Parcubacteria bacterium SG8_24]
MIGIFDSGLGGLTVVKEVFRQLPGRRVVYFGDTARTPYGTKSRRLIGRYAVQDAEFLLEQGAEVIVVACNTASAQAMDVLSSRIRVPVFEVVTPAVRAAAGITRGKVGIIGTRGTVGSGIYGRKMREMSPEVEVMAAPCPLFVSLVEEGWTEKPETLMIAKRYLNPLRLHGIDTLILGCTHYPFLRQVIGEAAGPEVRLVDPAAETAAELRRFLQEHPELDRRLRGEDHRFFASDRTEQFSQLASAWLGRETDLREATLE